MATIEEVLNEPDDSSQLSVEVSFTLQDILNEKLSEDSHDDEDVQGLFSDEEENGQGQTMSHTSKQQDKGSLMVKEADKAHERCSRISDTQIPDELLGKNMVFNRLSNVSRLFDTTDIKAVGVGVPSSISATPKFLAIGTSLSNIALFENNAKGFKVLQLSDCPDFGEVTCCNISRDNKYLLCGFSNGFISLWDLTYSTPIKTLPSSLNSPITKLLFWKNTYEEFISSDLDGNVFLYSIEKYVWVSVKNKRLVNRVNGVTYHDVRAGRNQNGGYFLGLVAVDFVVVLAVEPNVEVLAKIHRPYELSNFKMPNMEFGKMRRKDGGMQDAVFVSWSKTIYIYGYDNTRRTDCFSLLQTFKNEVSVYNMYYISERMLITLDFNNVFRLINLQSMTVNNTFNMPTEILTQKYHKDKFGKSMKLSANTICISTEVNKEMYIITKDSIFRGRLFRWNDFTYGLIKNQQWSETLKLMVELFYGRLDVFAEKVTISPMTVILFNEALLVYAKNRLGAAVQKAANESEDTKQIIETLDTCIEFCLKIRSYEFLYNKFYQTITNQFGLSFLFIKSQQPFMQTNMIQQIPNRRLYQSILQFYAVSDPSLVDKLVTNLDEQSIDYSLTVQICIKLKLYYSLVYVSQLNEDFITPANKLLEIFVSDQEKHKESEELLHKMIRLVSEGKAITGNNLSQRLTKTGIRVLLQWYLLEETATAIINQNPKLYFTTLSQLMVTDKVVEVIIELKNTVDFMGMIKQIMEYVDRVHNKQQLGQASECLLIINSKWLLDESMRMFCLHNLKPDASRDALAQFIDKNYLFLRQHPQWPSIQSKLPQQIQAVAAINQNNSALALDLYQKVSSDANARRRLFERVGRYFFSSNIERLAKLDCKRTADYLLEIYSGEEISPQIQSIKEPLLKYNLVRRVMREGTGKEIEWGKGLLLFYLDAMCRYRKERRVLAEVKKNIFSINQALEIVTKYGLKTCQAYLSQPEKAHRALELYQQVYTETFYKNYEKVINFEYSDCRAMKYAFDSMLNLLKHSALEADSKHWFELISTVLSPLVKPSRGKNRVADSIQNIYKKKGSQTNPFFSFLLQILQRTLLQVSMHTSIQQLTQQIQKYISIVDVPFILTSFRSTLTTFNRQCQIYQISNKLILKDLINNFNNIITQGTEGISAETECVKCSQMVMNSDSVVFRCGHTYHVRCLEERVKCVKCALEKVGVEEVQAEGRGKAERDETEQQEEESVADNRYVYSLLSFDRMVQDEEQNFEEFTALYDSYMLLHS